MYAMINNNGEVVDIRPEAFNPIGDCEIVRINGLKEGDELNYFIITQQLRDSDDDEPYRIVTTYSAIRQTATVARLRLDNEKLQHENAALILQVAGVEMSNKQLTQDHASLLLQLAEKGVL